MIYIKCFSRFSYDEHSLFWPETTVEEAEPGARRVFRVPFPLLALPVSG